MKKVLVISSSPVEGGNSDRLCDEFIRGAVFSGHATEKVFLRRSRIHFCIGCRLCDTGEIFCVHNDDAVDIVRAMLRSDVIVLSTPSYFSSMSAQMKTLVDRCLPAYRMLKSKEFYFIITGASPDKRGLYPVERTLESFTMMLEDSRIRGVLYAAGLSHSGEDLPEFKLQEAYSMGMGI